MLAMLRLFFVELKQDPQISGKVLCGEGFFATLGDV
jgi:hypothetical protein